MHSRIFPSKISLTSRHHAHDKKNGKTIRNRYQSKIFFILKIVIYHRVEWKSSTRKKSTLKISIRKIRQIERIAGEQNFDIYSLSD